MSNTPSFYALHGRWTGGDWFYKVYVTNYALCGAVVAGQYTDAASADTQLVVPAGRLRVLALPVAKKIVKARQTT